MFPFTLRLTILTHDSALHAALAEGLEPFGFDVHREEMVAGLLHGLAMNQCDLCVLDGSDDPHMTLSTAARLRAASAAGLIVLVPPDMNDIWVHSLLVGADAALRQPFEIRELVAVALALSRRLQGRSNPAVTPGMPAMPGMPGMASMAMWRAPAAVAPAANCNVAMHIEPPAAAAVADPVRGTAWSLFDDGWSLRSPDGVVLELSQAERVLFRALSDRPAGSVLSRETISELLEATLPRAVESSRYGLHRINMLISRVRKKAERAGARLPLRVVRGRGYEFHEPLQMREAAFSTPTV